MSQQLSLLDFLPAYSGINVDKGDPLNAFYASKIPDNIEREFYPATYLKGEFKELKAEEIEPIRERGKFRPMSQQLFISRFMSQYTPYDRLLLFHEVGTGKCIHKTSYITTLNGKVQISV